MDKSPWCDPRGSERQMTVTSRCCTPVFCSVHLLHDVLFPPVVPDCLQTYKRGKQSRSEDGRALPDDSSVGAACFVVYHFYSACSFQLTRRNSHAERLAPGRERRFITTSRCQTRARRSGEVCDATPTDGVNQMKPERWQTVLNVFVCVQQEARTASQGWTQLCFKDNVPTLYSYSLFIGNCSASTQLHCRLTRFCFFFGFKTINIYVNVFICSFRQTLPWIVICLYHPPKVFSHLCSAVSLCEFNGGWLTSWKVCVIAT